MPFKSVLTPHHSIPPPILAILVGRLPQVSTTIQDVAEEAAAAAAATAAAAGKKDKANTDTEDDSWDNDWGWGDDDDDDDDEGEEENEDHTKASPADTDSQDTATTPALAPLTEPYLVSASANGHYLVLAHESKFLVLELIQSDGEYSAVGQGSGCEAEGETITAILCIPLFVPSIRKNQMFVMAGYSTGWIRVFSETGTMLTAQLLEPSPVVSLKLRTPPPVFKVSPHAIQHEDEEITILFQNKRVVSIDGQSLWMVLRVCDGQRESGIDASRMQTAFAYKKYEFQKQEQIKDVISLGPSPPLSQSTMLDGSVSTTHTTYPFPANSTSRYIAVGGHPMLCYYATSESTRPLMSAVSMASYVVSRVTSPVFSLAKSWWTGSASSTPSSRSNSPTPYVPDMHPPPSHIEPACALSPTLTINDSYRRITSISAAPPSTSAQRHTLAVTSDMLGRVILWDVQSGEMIRMWKGIRDAVCGWVEIYDDNDDDDDQRDNNTSMRASRVLLFLVVYSERRGLVLTYQMRHGKQVGMYRIGQGWRLVQCGREPLGSSMVSTERRRMAMQKNEGECGYLAKCLLIGPDGQIRNVEIENVKRS